MSIIPSIVAAMEKKAATSSLLVALYSRIYNEVIRNEISLAGITAGDLVVNVGCGGIPFSAIQVARLTGARVLAIDCDEDAVHSARRCISSLGMEGQVEVACADGSKPLPVEFDVALVALQAEPKKLLLDNLMAGCASHGRLVFRQPRRELSHQYDLLPDEPAYCDEIKQKQVTFDSSVLYISGCIVDKETK